MQKISRWLAPAMSFAALVLMLACGGSGSPPEETDSTPTLEPLPAMEFAGRSLYILPGPEKGLDVPDDLRAAIQEGVELMSSMRMEMDKCGGRKRHGWRRCLGDYLIAAANADGEVIVVEAYQDRPSHPPEFSVRCERNDNSCDVGVNVPLVVEAPPGWTVVAVRTAVWDKGGSDNIAGAVYVPYSSRLNTPELRLAGLAYITDTIERAHAELKTNQVSSQYIKGALASDFGTPEHILTLLLTEQMRSARHFVEGDDEVRVEMLGRTLTIIGANLAGTSRYSRSRVGAAGLLQPMPRTYRALDKQYPLADLPDDVVDGRVKHHSAIKAAIVHTDSEWWPVRGESGHREWLLKNEWSRKLFFAAGYNANVRLVDKAIHACGDQWRQASCRKLPEETRQYLVKYEWIYRTLFDEAFRYHISIEGVSTVTAQGN